MKKLAALAIAFGMAIGHAGAQQCGEQDPDYEGGVFAAGVANPVDAYKLLSGAWALAGIIYHGVPVVVTNMDGCAERLVGATYYDPSACLETYRAIQKNTTFEGTINLAIWVVSFNPGSASYDYLFLGVMTTNGVVRTNVVSRSMFDIGAMGNYAYTCNYRDVRPTVIDTKVATHLRLMAMNVRRYGFRPPAGPFPHAVLATGCSISAGGVVIPDCPKRGEEQRYRGKVALPMEGSIVVAATTAGVQCWRNLLVTGVSHWENSLEKTRRLTRVQLPQRRGT